jgi:hypothetical protein
MSETTIKEMQDVCKRIVENQAQIESMQMKIKPLSEDLEKHKKILMAFLDQNEMSSFKAQGFTFVVAEKFSVETPKGEDRPKFFDWCAEKKGWEFVKQSFTMNSQSLQGFYKAEQEVAVQEKNIDFKIPGIGEPKAFKMLQIRKG